MTRCVNPPSWRHKIMAYMAVGVLNTTLCAALMALGAHWGWPYALYTFFGYSLAILFSFFMNLRYTFRVNDHVFKRMVLFFSISLTNLVLVEGLEYVLIEYLHCQEWVAVGVGMVWYIVIGFLLNQWVVYRQRLGSLSTSTRFTTEKRSP